MSDQAEQAVASVEDRLMALIDGPDEDNPPPEPEVDEATQTEDVEAQAETEPEAPEYEEIVWNGETKKLTKDELKNLAQQGFDYTQKTQALAETRKAIEAEREREKQVHALQGALADQVAELKLIDAQIEKFRAVNWADLAENNPTEYLKLNTRYRELKDLREDVFRDAQGQAEKLKSETAAQAAEKLKKEAERLVNALPVFKSEKAAEAKAEVKAYLRNAGFEDLEIETLTDSRAVVMAWKAAQYDKLQAKKPEVTAKAAQAPKPVKPGAANLQNSRPMKDTREALRKTGKGEYAQKLIEQML